MWVCVCLCFMCNLPEGGFGSVRPDHEETEQQDTTTVSSQAHMSVLIQYQEYELFGFNYPE